LDEQRLPGESQWMLQLVLDTIPVRVFWKDRNCVFLGCNQLFASDAGFSTVEDIVGKTDYDVPWKEQADLYQADDRAVMETGTPKLHYEEPQRTPDGRIIWLRTSKIPLRDSDGHVIGVMGVYEDITERKEAENALRISEERYRELIENTNSIILRWGRDGTVRFLNEFGQSFFGYKEREIVGRNVIGTIVSETETSGRDLRAMIADILAHPERHETNVNENMRKDGERVWIAWTNKLVLSEQGDVTEILSVGLDITARKHAEDALHESEERYRSIFNSNVDAFLLFDIEGRIVDTNARACELYGYSRRKLIGLSGRDIVDPGHYHMFESFAGTALGEWFAGESLHVRRDGKKFDVEVHGTRLRDGGKERLLAIIFDVTERNETRESMRLFSDVVHNMQLGLYIYELEDPEDDRTLRLTATNPASTADMGLRQREIIGRYIDDVFPDLRDQGIPQRFADVVRTGRPFRVTEFAYSDTNLSPKYYSFRVFSLPGSQVGVLFEDITDQVQARDERRRFYRKTIEAATEGKLLICDREEIKQMAGPPIATSAVRRPEDLGRARRMVAEIASAEGMDETRVFDLVLCAGEATTNAIKHADKGTATVHRRDDGALLVVVTDTGPGIQEINLPDVALKRGYTTAVSLGMGYKAMISVADQVYLATGPKGTTVAVEMSLHAKPPQTSNPVLPDTW